MGIFTDEQIKGMIEGVQQGFSNSGVTLNERDNTIISITTKILLETVEAMLLTTPEEHGL